MDQLVFHDMTLTWLNGGTTTMDGGAMFGVVPKPLWTRKYPVNEKNQIELVTEPILVNFHNKHYLIDAGVGAGKLSDKQRRNYGVAYESQVEQDLAELGLNVTDIDVILMTHLHFDHAGGLTTLKAGRLVSTFPKAVIYVNEIEWEEMQHPNIRSKSTYWQENWVPIQEQIVTYREQLFVTPEIEMLHTGGHSKGHAIIRLHQQEERLIHMADIMPTHAHQNPLWVLAYDDYPMTSIFAKEALLAEAYQQQAQFIFYHDAFYHMIQWDQTGKEIRSSLKRSQPPRIPFPPKTE